MENWAFGIGTGSYATRTSLENAIRFLAEDGFTDLEIESWHLVEKDFDRETAPERLRSLRELLTDLALTVRQLHAPFGNDLVAESESERIKHVDVFKRWIDIALAVGAKAMVIHIGGCIRVCWQKKYEDIFAANAKSLAELASHAGKSDLILAIENLMSGEMRIGYRIADLKALIAAAGSEKIGICLDTGHANVEGLDVPTAIEECGPLLAATHIQESCPGNDLHMFPFSLRRVKSSMNWFQIFDAFKRVGYRKPLIGECANHTGELPLELVREYTKAQKRIVEVAMHGDFRV